MDDERHWCVYRHRNKTNGKIYIGITGKDPQKRWNSGYKHSVKFYNAILKYGWNGFYHEVLINGLTKQQAQDMEIYLIKQLHTQDDRYGYNIEPGGSVSPMSDQTKRKISQSNKGHGDRGGGFPKKKVRCIQNCIVFQSVSSAAKWCCSNSSHISQCCKGILKSVKGYHWQYVSDKVALTTIESIA